MKDENEQGLDTGEDCSGDWAGRPIDAVKRSKKREMYTTSITLEKFIQSIRLWTTEHVYQLHDTARRVCHLESRSS